MYRLIRFYNQNRKKVWIAIAIILFAILVIQILNSLAKAKLEKDANANKIVQNSVQENYSYSIMSQKKVDTADVTKNNKVVDEFMEYCNNGNVQEAYDLLTDECKKQLYPTVEIFTNNYHKAVFSTPKTYTMQSWYSDDVDTYKIRILEDMLSSGTYNTNQVIEDYYTVIHTKEGIKLNINSYVNTQEINEGKNVSGVEVKVVKKDVYMDYEIYHVEVRNTRKNTIMLDTKTSANSTYLTGENKAKYSSFIYEVAEDDLILEEGKTREISIKYNKMYQPERKIANIIFSDIILNYEEYQNDKNTANKAEMKIDL